MINQQARIELFFLSFMMMTIFGFTHNAKLSYETIVKQLKESK